MATHMLLQLVRCIKLSLLYLVFTDDFFIKTFGKTDIVAPNA